MTPHLGDLATIIRKVATNMGEPVYRATGRHADLWKVKVRDLYLTSNEVSALREPAGPSPDEQASGTNRHGERWTVARYGCLVITVIGTDSDDVHFRTADEAHTEYMHQVHELRS